MIEVEFAALYLKTRVTVLQDGVHIPARESTLAAAGSFHVLTAWNPGHRRPAPDAGAGIRPRLQPRRAVLGCRRPDRCAGLTDAQACAIGSAYGQVAVFRIDPAQQTVLACDGAWQVSRTS